jgi:glycosyltransferase involved in cell wall biosynthesis
MDLRALVSTYPDSASVGRYNKNLWALGLYSNRFYFDVNSRRRERSPVRPEYSRIASRWLPPRVAYALSFYMKTHWSSVASGFDLVHVTSPEFFHLSRNHACVVGTVHDLYPLDSRWNGVLSLAYRAAFKRDLQYVRRLSGCIAVSHETARKVRELFPATSPVVIHHWTPRCFHPRSKAEARTLLGLPLEEFLILNVSDNAPNKGIGTLVLLSQLLSRHARIVRIGPDISDRINSNRVIQVTQFLPDERLALYYNAADLYVAPSTDEGFNHPIIEAINSGTPVVASKIPIFREILRNSPYLVPVSRVDSWVQVITELFAPDRLVAARTWYDSHIGDYYREDRGRAEMSRFLEAVVQARR